MRSRWVVIAVGAALVVAARVLGGCEGSAGGGAADVRPDGRMGDDTDAGAGCAAPDPSAQPAGCAEGLCPAGTWCPPDRRQCVPGSCTCTAGAWACTADCRFDPAACVPLGDAGPDALAGPDAGDGAAPDAGEPDAAAPDGGPQDTATPDAGPDAGPDAAAPADVARPDAAPADVAPADAAGPDVGPQGPAPGTLGGLCGPDGGCEEGDCQAVPGRAEERCTRPCTSNDECPATLRCEAVTEWDMLCLPGARGTGALGEPCGPERGNGCASGLCVDADPDAGIPVDTCTDACASDAECAPPFPICYAWVDLCLPVGSGDLGGRCPVVGSCDEGVCTALAGVGERCTRACAVDADCGAPYLVCQAFGDGSFCVVPPGDTR